MSSLPNMTDGDRFSTAQQQACAYLRERILSGEFRCDSALDPTVIANQLGISRMPVREALRQLDAEGLVTMRPNRKAIVTNLTANEVEDLFEMRAAIETLAVRSAMAAMDKTAIAELQLLAQRMNNAADNWKTWLQRHDEFHQYISELSGRPRISKEIIRLRQAVQPYLLISMTASGQTEMAGHEHSSLVQVFASSDVAAAEAAIASHVLHAKASALHGLHWPGARSRETRESDHGHHASATSSDRTDHRRLA
jgi:DNA-binding GntR family transcriptional regulator